MTTSLGQWWNGAAVVLVCGHAPRLKRGPIADRLNREASRRRSRLGLAACRLASRGGSAGGRSPPGRNPWPKPAASDCRQALAELSLHVEAADPMRRRATVLQGA